MHNINKNQPSNKGKRKQRLYLGAFGMILFNLKKIYTNQVDLLCLFIIRLAKNLFSKNALKKCRENYIIIVTNQGEWFYGKWHIYRNKEENRIG